MSNNFFNFNHLILLSCSQHNNQINIMVLCRICNRVLTTFQSVMIHVEAHIVAQANHDSRRLNQVNSQRQLIHNNPLQPNIPRVPILRQRTRNPVVGSRVFQAPPPQQPMLMSQPRTNPYANMLQGVAASQPLLLPPPQVIPSAGNNNNVVAYNNMAQLPPPPCHQGNMEVSPIDGTKPYIVLLDKPIINNNEFIDLANINGGDTMNLVLKL